MKICCVFRGSAAGGVLSGGDISDEEAVSLIDLEVPRVERNSSWQEMSSGGNVLVHIHTLRKYWRDCRLIGASCVSNSDALLCTELLNKWIKKSKSSQWPTCKAI